MAEAISSSGDILPEKFHMDEKCFAHKRPVVLKDEMIPLPASPKSLLSPLPSAPPSSPSAPASPPPSSSLVNLKFQPPSWYRHNNNPKRGPGEICWQHEEICEQVDCTLRRLGQLPGEGEEIREKKMKEKMQREEKMQKALEDQMEHLRQKRISKMKNKKNKKKNKKKLRRRRKLEEEEVCGIPQHMLETWFTPEQIASWPTPKHPPEEDEHSITPEEDEHSITPEQEEKNEYQCEEDEWLPPAKWTVQEGKRYDFSKILSGKTTARDYLVKNNGDQVDCLVACLIY